MPKYAPSADDGAIRRYFSPDVPVTVNPDTGVISDPRIQEAVASGGSSQRSILTVGGDHPYKQWWGNDMTDGMAAMYKAVNIKPYIAICADESPVDITSGLGATLDKPGMMTSAQAQALEQQGAEFISHGARHTHVWRQLNTGIRVWYTGAEATPTINVSTTQLTISSATTGNTVFTWAAFPTVAQLRTAIKATAGWNCELATELLGTEPTPALMPLAAARSVVTVGAADASNNNQRLALSGGILLSYTGLAYRNVSVSLNDGSNFIGIWADGVRLFSTSTAATLTSLVTAINALNVLGLTALVMDNGFRAATIDGSTGLNPGQTQRESYCYGDELATSLHRIPQMQPINFTGVQCSGGLGFAYSFRRTIAATKERAASIYGVTLSSFAQSGGHLFPWHVRGMLEEHVQWRGNRSFTENYSGISPHAMPANTPGSHTGHFTSIVSSSPGAPYQESDVKAIIDALADSNGWCVNWLNHLCTPDGQSPFTGLNQQSPGTYPSSADQDEGPFWRELQHAAAARDAGLIDILPPTAAELARKGRAGPVNLVFNSKFRNGRNNNLNGITTVTHGSGGIACSGWAVKTSATDFSSVTVDPVSRELTAVTNGALGSNKTFLGHNLFLEPGKTYDIGATLNLVNWGSVNNVRLVLYPLNNSNGEHYPAITNSVNSPAFFGGGIVDAAFRFTVPPRSAASPAFIRSIAGPFSFTAGDSITVNIDNRGTSAPIVLTGLTSARAIANAINTALVSDAVYANLGQYHAAARSEENRLILEAPLSSASPGDGLSLTQINNSAGTPLAALFGAGLTSARACSTGHDNLGTNVIGYAFFVLPSTTTVSQSLGITAPFCTEFNP